MESLVIKGEMNKDKIIIRGLLLCEISDKGMVTGNEQTFIESWLWGTQRWIARSLRPLGCPHTDNGFTYTPTRPGGHTSEAYPLKGIC